MWEGQTSCRHPETPEAVCRGGVRPHRVHVRRIWCNRRIPQGGMTQGGRHAVASATIYYSDGNKETAAEQEFRIIDEASKASKVSAKMIRCCEQIGLIAAAQRTASDHRAYGHADMHQLHFIRRTRDLGCSVAESGDLLNPWNPQSRQSADVKRLAKRTLSY